MKIDEYFLQQFEITEVKKKIAEDSTYLDDICTIIPTNTQSAIEVIIISTIHAPLASQARKYAINFIKMLIENNVNFNEVQTNDGVTSALTFAAQAGDAYLAKILIEARTHSNVQNISVDYPVLSSALKCPRDSNAWIAACIDQISRYADNVEKNMPGKIEFRKYAKRYNTKTNSFENNPLIELENFIYYELINFVFCDKRENPFMEILQSMQIRSKSFNNALFRLGDSYEMIKDFPRAVALYQEVNEISPHFREAQDKIYNIVNIALTEHAEGKLELSDTELREYKELQFISSLKANKDQNYIDGLFHELLGNKGLTPTHKNIGANVETLLALSREMIELKSENKKLQDENARLRNSKLKLFDKNLDSDLNQNASQKNMKRRSWSY